MSRFELPVDSGKLVYGSVDMSIEHTDPIARKNEKVAALLSMYCDNVARKPLGPAPPLAKV